MIQRCAEVHSRRKPEVGKVVVYNTVGMLASSTSGNNVSQHRLLAKEANDQLNLSVKALWEEDPFDLGSS